MTRFAGVLLAPGAGTDASHPSLLALDEAIRTRLGIPVHRMDFPYRRAGRRAPDRPAVLVQALRDEAGAFASRLGVATGELVVGGRSMGGRIASMAVAEGMAAAGLVMIAYPLHPPGKPDRLRVAHLPAIGVPCLFVSGTRDAFGTPDELVEHTATIPGPVTHAWIEGAGHDLRRADAAVAEQVTAWLDRWGGAASRASRRPAGGSRSRGPRG